MNNYKCFRLKTVVIAKPQLSVSRAHQSVYFNTILIQTLIFLPFRLSSRLDIMPMRKALQSFVPNRVFSAELDFRVKFVSIFCLCMHLDPSAYSGPLLRRSLVDTRPGRKLPQSNNLYSRLKRLPFLCRSRLNKALTNINASLFEACLASMKYPPSRFGAAVKSQKH